jgi:hypothetical protein
MLSSFVQNSFQQDKIMEENRVLKRKIAFLERDIEACLEMIGYIKEITKEIEKSK